MKTGMQAMTLILLSFYSSEVDVNKFNIKNKIKNTYFVPSILLYAVGRGQAWVQRWKSHNLYQRNQ